MFQHFKQVSRLSLNDQFLGDQGSTKLAQFIENHGKVEALEIKSNDIGPEGFQLIFRALERCPIKYLVCEYNNMGLGYEGVQQLQKLLRDAHKLEYLNLGSNKLEDGNFDLFIKQIANSSSLKLLELKFNSLTTKSIQKLIFELKNANNKTLLFVDLSGNKISKSAFDELQQILKANRKLNPISRQKLQTINVRDIGNITGGTSFLPNQSKLGQTGNLNNTYGAGSLTGFGTGATDLTSQSLVRHLQNLLDQGRRQTTQMKIRMQKQLQQLQRRQKFDAKQLIDLDNNCNQLVLFNRNLKFQLDRCISQQQQIERQHSQQVRSHEQKIRQANKELSQLQSKYQNIEDRMNKEHVIRMKELGRDWDNKLRALEDRIRMVEIQNNDLDQDIRKTLEKRERVKIQMMDEENNIIQRVQQQEANRYNLKLTALESKLSEIQAARELYLRRNSQMISEMETMQIKNSDEISNLEAEIQSLKHQQQTFLKNNREFITTNQKLSGDIKLKEMTFQKLEAQINSLNEQIQHKKRFNKDQIDRVLQEQSYQKKKYQEDKAKQMEKLNQLQRVLRASQIENTRLRQQYISLAQTVQMNVNKTIEHVFASNNLY